MCLLPSPRYIRLNDAKKRNKGREAKGMIQQHQPLYGSEMNMRVALLGEL